MAEMMDTKSVQDELLCKTYEFFFKQHMQIEGIPAIKVYFGGGHHWEDGRITECSVKLKWRISSLDEEDVVRLADIYKYNREFPSGEKPMVSMWVMPHEWNFEEQKYVPFINEDGENEIQVELTIEWSEDVSKDLAEKFKDELEG